MLTDAQIAKLTVTIYPDPILRIRCLPVESFGAWLEALARRMIGLMREHQGVGLAAPQVGLPLRLFVANATPDNAADRLYVNPVLSGPGSPARHEEGCLSIPEVSVTIERAASMTIRAYDALGRPFESTAEGLLARAWQHECDHLDGRLIIDYMDTQAELVNRKALKALTLQYKPKPASPRRRSK